MDIDTILSSFSNIEIGHNFTKLLRLTSRGEHIVDDQIV